MLVQSVCSVRSMPLFTVIMSAKLVSKFPFSVPVTCIVQHCASRSFQSFNCHLSVKMIFG